MAWYYARGDERMGPVDDAELAHLAASGAVTSETLVWQEGMADWQPYGAVASAPGMAADMPPSIFGEQPPQVCAECGRAFRSEDMVSYEQHWVCADCKDVFFQRIREGVPVPGSLLFGGFWIRFCARVVDGVILGFVGLVQSVVQAPLTGGFGVDPTREPAASELIILVLSTILSIVIGIAYEVLFVGKYAATPGKMVFGLKVVMGDGGRVTYARATGCYFAMWLSSLTLMIGYIIAAFDSEKRALHDHICDTRVIRN